MTLFPLIATCVSLLIWIVLTFFRGAFWQLHSFDDDLAQLPEVCRWPRITALIPARNEAETITRTVESLAMQAYPGELQIVVIDDHSEDATAALARGAAAKACSGRRIEIISAKGLEEGWTGKLWALQRGVDHVSTEPPDYFWLTDADIVHAPDTLNRLVGRAEKDRLDLTSLMVLLQAKSIPERLLIPPFLYFFLKLYPPKWIATRESQIAGAAGGCVLLRREALERIGGLTSIRSEVIDDCSLARKVKSSGGAIWMGLTRKSESLRSYTSFREIRDLIARTAFTQLGYSAVLLIGTILGMTLTYLLPVILTFSPVAPIWRISLLTWILMTITYLPTSRYYRLSALWAATLPLAAAFYSYATWVSAVRYWMGRGGQWKGRAQAQGKIP